METVAEVLNDTTTKIQKSFEALKALMTAEEVAALRGLSVEDVKA